LFRFGLLRGDGRCSTGLNGLLSSSLFASPGGLSLFIYLRRLVFAQVNGFTRFARGYF